MTAPRVDPAALSSAVDALGAGRLVLFPTETVFGLGAALRDERAIRLLYDLKRRPLSRPLLAHVADEAMARSLVSIWPDRAAALARRFWPGPLAIVLPRAECVPALVAGGGDNIGLRCPDHPAALALIHAAGGPIAATSANAHGEPPVTTADEARALFPADLVEVLDSPPAPTGTPSTVVLLGATPAEDRVLREGPIPAADLGVEPD